MTGLLFPVSFLSEWLGYLGWICFVPLLFAIYNESSKKALIYGIISGTVTNFIALYWLIGTLTRFGEIPIPVSIVLILIFCIYSSLQFGIFSFLVARFKLLTHISVINCLIVAMIWTSCEFFFPVLFPHGIANSQGFYLPIIQVVDFLGLNFLSFLILFVNITIFYTIQNKKTAVKVTSISAIIILLLFIYGHFKINEIEKITKLSEKIKVGIVQANFDFFEKNLENEFFITERHQDMSKQMVGTDLIIWPETAIQHWFSSNSEKYILKNNRKVAPEIDGTYFLVGGLSFIPQQLDEFKTNYIKKHNSAFLIDSKSNILGHYHKIKLLMFGEYFPYINKELNFLKRIVPLIGDLTPGRNLNILEIKEKNVKIGTLICYEDIIPYFSRKFTTNGANLLINLTNDAWFGRSRAPFMHMLVSIPRAVESRRYFIRSTNSGVSAIISPTGKVEKQTGIFTKENLQGEVRLINSYKTFYSKVGDIFPFISLLTVVLYIFKKYLIRKYSF